MLRSGERTIGLNTSQVYIFRINAWNKPNGGNFHRKPISVRWEGESLDAAYKAMLSAIHFRGDELIYVYLLTNRKYKSIKLSPRLTNQCRLCNLSM